MAMIYLIRKSWLSHVSVESDTVSGKSAFIPFFLVMAKIAEIKEIQAALKPEKSRNVKILHRFIFDNDSVIKNDQRIRKFTGLSFETKIEEYEENNS